MLSKKCVIAKDVKAVTTVAISKARHYLILVGEKALVPNRTTHYHAQLGPPDKGHAIKRLVFC